MTSYFFQIVFTVPSFCLVKLKTVRNFAQLSKKQKHGVITIKKKAAKALIAAVGAAGAMTAAQATAHADTTVTVASGDTIWAYAQQYKTTVSSIVSANSLSNPDLIFPGQRITIPETTINRQRTASVRRLRLRRPVPRLVPSAPAFLLIQAPAQVQRQLFPVL